MRFQQLLPEVTILMSSDFLANNLQRIDHTCKCNNCSTMLVVMERSEYHSTLSASSQSQSISVRKYPPGLHRRSFQPEGERSAQSHLTYLLRTQSGIASTSPNSLNRTHLPPSITGIPASGPISPSPSTAVPSVTTANCIPTSSQFITFINIFSESQGKAEQHPVCKQGLKHLESTLALDTTSILPFKS